jgi:hypothetical protein
MFFLAIQPHANKSYYEFQHSYKPHNKLLDPKNPLVLSCANETADFISSLLSQIIKKKDYTNFQLIICSVKRNQIDSILSKMNRKILMEGLNILEQEWLQEILYYLKEKTYNELMFQAR